MGWFLGPHKNSTLILKQNSHMRTLLTLFSTAYLLSYNGNRWLPMLSSGGLYFTCNFSSFTCMSAKRAFSDCCLFLYFKQLRIASPHLENSDLYSSFIVAVVMGSFLEWGFFLLEVQWSLPSGPLRARKGSRWVLFPWPWPPVSMPVC